MTSLVVVFKKIARTCLMCIYRFEKWHTSPAENRDYVKNIIEILIKKKSRNSVVEIGCGLGDIIRKVDYKKKYYLDLSPNVLEAAKFLTIFSKFRSEDSFCVFDFVTDSFLHPVDAVVLVNWIHNIDPDTLKNRIDVIVNDVLNESGFLIFDIVDENRNYQFNHKISDLLVREDLVIREYECNKFDRRIVVAEKK